MAFKFGLVAKDLGIDLGTANSLVYVKGRGVVLLEPSVVAIRKETGQVLAVGNEAKQMIGRTPGNIVAIRPMKDGVIADFDITYNMLKHFLSKALGDKTYLIKPNVVVCVPSGATAVEERAIRDAALAAGAREAYLIEEPMAAAIGAGLPVEEPTGNLIVDIGGGTTEVAVISFGGIVTSQSLRIAGDEMDEAIINHIKKSYNLMIGERTAEEIKINIGSAYPQDTVTTYEVKGRDLITGLPRTVEVSSEEIYKALKEPVSAIVEAIKSTLEKTPPELAADIMDHGIMLAGGGSLLKGLDKLISIETHMPVHVAEEPMYCVAYGTGKALENLHVLRNVLKTPKKSVKEA